MFKKVLYAVVCFMVFASHLILLTSCGAKVEGMGVTAELSKSEYVVEGNYSTAVVTVDVTNYNEGHVLTGCSVKLYFKDMYGSLIDTKTATFSNVNVSAGETETFSALFDPAEGFDAISGEVYSVSSSPYSMTLEEVGEEIGSFGSILGIVGAIIGIVFVGGVIYGLFFD